MTSKIANEICKALEAIVKKELGFEVSFAYRLDSKDTYEFRAGIVDESLLKMFKVVSLVAEYVVLYKEGNPEDIHLPLKYLYDHHDNEGHNGCNALYVKLRPSMDYYSTEKRVPK